MSTVLFRCDASPAIGMGHWIRCLNLADALADLGQKCVIATQGTPESIGSMVTARGHRLEQRPGEAAVHGRALGMEDASWFWALCESHGSASVVLDHYGIHEDWLHAAPSSAPPVRLLLEDVDRDRGLDAVDIVSCPTPGSESWFQGFDGMRCCGPKWALLHGAFAAARPAKAEASSQIESVMVAMGGSDPAGLVPVVLDALTTLRPSPEVTVVGFQSEEQAPPAGLKTHWRHGLLPEEMASLMVASDLVVTTPSTTMWELATIGRPAIVIPAAENQHPNARALQHLEAARVVWDRRALVDALAEMRTREARQRTIERAREITDGLGATRLARVLEETAER